METVFLFMLKMVINMVGWISLSVIYFYVICGPFIFIGMIFAAFISMVREKTI